MCLTKCLGYAHAKYCLLLIRNSYLTGYVVLYLITIPLCIKLLFLPQSTREHYEFPPNLFAKFRICLVSFVFLLSFPI